MNQQQTIITLTPSHWLYNAGVIGFLRVLEKLDPGIVDKELLSKGGVVKIKIDQLRHFFEGGSEGEAVPLEFRQIPSYWWKYFEATLGLPLTKEDVVKSYLERELGRRDLKSLILADVKSEGKGKKAILKIKEKKGKKQYKPEKLFYGEDTGQEWDLKPITHKLVEIYNNPSNGDKINLVDPAIWGNNQEELVKYLFYHRFRQSLGAIDGNYKNWINNSIWNHLKKIKNVLEQIQAGIVNTQVDDLQVNGICFLCGEKSFVEKIDYMFSSDLFPAQGLPNSFWNMNTAIEYCKRCKFFLVHRHLGFISLSRNEQIFINAPSFQVMWHLNRYARDVLSRTSSAREILGLSLIEATLRQQLVIHKWTAHNVEVVVKRDDKIDFVQLPAEVVELLNDGKVAKLLNRLKEITILNRVLNMQFDWLLETGQYLLRLTTKDSWSKNDWEYLRSVLPFHARKDEKTNKSQINKSKLNEIAYQLLTLYALISEKVTTTIKI